MPDIPHGTSSYQFFAPTDDSFGYLFYLSIIKKNTVITNGF